MTRTYAPYQRGERPSVARLDMRSRRGKPDRGVAEDVRMALDRVGSAHAR
jgi:hypothetical protein